MEDSFKVRVDKIFGTLAPASSPSSSWSITDEEIERREWNRPKDSPEPAAKHHRLGSVSDLPKEHVSEMVKDLDDDGDELEMKKSIGADCTLDFQVEEDEHDRIAVGKGKGEDHVHMNDVLDYAIDIDSCYELPSSFRDVGRDPRANHVAAKFRLIEDAEESKKVESLGITEKDELPVVGGVKGRGMNPKSILKRKDGQLDQKSQKRVRFDPESEDNCKEENEAARSISMDSCSAEEVTVSNEAPFLARGYSSVVPDYIQNPSRYTHYTFDSLDDANDEEANRQAYMDFLNLVNQSKRMGTSPEDEYDDLPAVTFIPRKKPRDATLVQASTHTNKRHDSIGKDSISMHAKTLTTRVAAAGIIEEGEACAMDEDGLERIFDRKGGSERMNRRYRMKGHRDTDEAVS